MNNKKRLIKVRCQPIMYLHLVYLFLARDTYTVLILVYIKNPLFLICFQNDGPKTQSLRF